MSFFRFKKFLLALSVVFLSVVLPAVSVRAEIIDLDLSGITVAFAEDDEGLSPAAAERFVTALRRAEAFWDARILGYSNTLPRDIQSGLNGRLLIFAANANLGANILGSAGPITNVLVVRGGIFNQRQFAVATTSAMQFDNQFLEVLNEDEVTDLCIHEMGHALGLGSLWRANGLIQRFRGIGPEQFVGINARRAFSIEAGVAGQARTGFVPIEQQGGAGTALGHWEDDSPVFNQLLRSNRIEIMTGTMIPNAECFLSRTSLGSLVNEDELIPPSQLAGNQVALGLDDAEEGNLTGFSSNPFGANQLLNQSRGAGQPRRTLNIYKKRRK
jgi:hypothetical protein